MEEKQNEPLQPERPKQRQLLWLAFSLALNVYSGKTKAFLKPDLYLFPLPHFSPPQVIH